MNDPLFNFPFDPAFANAAMFVGALILNISGILFFISALIRFVLKPGAAKISAKQCFLLGSMFLFVGLLCMFPSLANMFSMRETIKNILP